MNYIRTSKGATQVSTAPPKVLPLYNQGQGALLDDYQSDYCLNP